MRFVKSPNGERMKDLIYSILSKHEELHYIKIYAYVLLSVEINDYAMQSQYNLQITLNEMIDVELIERTPSFTYKIKEVKIDPIPQSTTALYKESLI